jgi:hypothetical protein
MTQTGVRTNIFGIGEVYELQREGLWVERNRESYREFGYFGGSGDGGTAIKSSIERIDYSNDTTNTNFRSPLTQSKGEAGGVSNSNFGYFGAGLYSSRVDRIDYINDTASLIIRGPLNRNRGRVGTSGNVNFGYFVAGYNFPSPVFSLVERIDYSNDLAQASLRSSLTSNVNAISGTGNSNFGYFGGGYTPGVISTIQRIEYINDVSGSLVRSFLSISRGYTGASGNSNFGYFSGGGSGYYSRVDRLNYSNDTSNAIIRGPLSRQRTYINSATGSSNFGYYGGGSTASPANDVTLIDRIDYSNDTTTASVRGSFNTGRNSVAATSSSSFGGSPISYLGAPWSSTAPFGYFGGGPGPVSRVDRVDYANDTLAASVRGPLSLARNLLAATGNSNFGYFGGGNNPAITGSVSITERVDYSNDLSLVSLRGPLSVARQTLSAVGNSNFGYFLSGDIQFPSAIFTTVDRIDYSNDSAVASVRGPLPDGVRLGAAAGTANFGYYVGGAPDNNYRSFIRRIDYSNDLASPLYRGNLTIATSHSGASGAGNSNFGYFVTGRTNPVITNRSNIQRIDYANDTVLSSVRGPLSGGTGNGASGTGNSNFGYFNRGIVVDRIDYSNDTQAASLRGPLSSSKGYSGSTSSQAFGGAPNTSIDPLPAYIRDATKWIDSNTLDLPFKRVLGSYGYYGGLDSKVDRVDYSNDTQISSIRGPLVSSRYLIAATGNSNFGYFGGGAIPGPIVVSRIERIDYSNDLSTPVIRGRLSQLKYYMGATGTQTFGYFVGGISGPTPLSRVDRIDYSNDDATTSVRGPLSLARRQLAASGNSNFGYFGGGTAAPAAGPFSTIDRIDYSNDTSTASVRGPLSIARSLLAATGNSNFGYFGGGSGPVSTVDRIDYSNDTSTASVRGPLSSARSYLAASGNSNFGYFGGGTIGGGSSLSTIDRIDYSNDLVVTPSKRIIKFNKIHSLAATTNARSS